MEVLENVRGRLQLEWVFQAVTDVIHPASFQAGTDQIPVISLGSETEQYWQPGTCSAWGGESAYRYFTRAIKWVQSGNCSAIVTAPLNKKALSKAGINFPGHTEILAHYTGKERAWMMLDTGELRAVMVTLHMGLCDALKKLSKETVLETIEITDKALRQIGFENPRLGVAGLNPHAGENGLFGKEEELWIGPAVRKAREIGINVTGPCSPDTVFIRHRQGEFDAVIALYHDQALIPLKLTGFGNSVNITLGTPIIRTSVDHGTAFDRAEQYDADPSSMTAAIKMAIKLSRNQSFRLN